MDSSKHQKIFVRDSFESFLQELIEVELPPVGYENHKRNLMTDLIFDYVMRQSTCVANKRNKQLTEKSRHKASLVVSTPK